MSATAKFIKSYSDRNYQHATMLRHKGTVIAFAAWEANNLGMGWFGPMGTAPEARGEGIGRLLLLRCLEDMRNAGRRCATIPWVGPVPFYEQTVGARVWRTYIRYEKTLE